MGRRRIVSDPPLVVPAEELFADIQADAVYAEIQSLVDLYGETLSASRRHLLHQFRLVQVARKVVGVGSVGLRCWMLLLAGRQIGVGVHQAEPLDVHGHRSFGRASPRPLFP